MEGIEDLRAGLPILFVEALVYGFLAWLLLHAEKSPLAPAQEEPREPPLWGGQEILWVFAAWLLVPICIGVLLSASGIAVSDLVGFLVNGAAQLLVCGFALYLVLGRLGQPPATLGLVPVRARHLAGTALLFFLSLAPLGLVATVWMLFLHDGLGREVELQELVTLIDKKIKEGDFAYVVAAGLNAIVVAPIVEEVFFRGLFFGWLRARMGTAAAAIISSVVFAGLHPSLTAFASLMLLALILCALYARTRSIFPCMLFHAMLNGQTMLLLVLRSAGEETS